MIRSLPDNFLLGCDPEVFIVDETGRPVSAEGLLPGTKDEPFKVDHGAVQVDGMAGEFNIDPASTFAEFRDNVRSVMSQMKEMLPTGYDFLVAPSVEFDREVWDAAPDKAKELGCMPDFNAWTGGVNPPPRNYQRPTLRTAAGHLHVGFTKGAKMSDIDHIMNCNSLVKQLDWYLGGWSVFEDKGGGLRRSLYGKAGACRYKDYGVEYRVLSNFWLKDDDVMANVWNRLCLAISDMSFSFVPLEAGPDYNKKLIAMIESSIPDNKVISRFHYPLLAA
jgi:Phage phiEco32-like COOH.NH2 ligase-type 2